MGAVGAVKVGLKLIDEKCNADEEGWVSEDSAEVVGDVSAGYTRQ